MSAPLVINNFEVPSWAGKPPPGLHLDVMKEGKMVQKLMIDEKKCYFFGRNKTLCDFSIEHASCSRVHAVLVWHKHLNRPFLWDLGSAHGTFIGSIRLEMKQPQQVPIDSEIHFGASSRRYIIRERPQTSVTAMHTDEKEEMEGGLLGLPETETELDNLTEFNTANNRRIMSVSELAEAQSNQLKRKRKSTAVHFHEDEIIINPEDIDPSVGRFRNMVQTTVIPNKKQRMEAPPGMPQSDAMARRMQQFNASQLSAHRAAAAHGGALHDHHPHDMSHASIVSKLGLRVPNLAPDVDLVSPTVQQDVDMVQHGAAGLPNELYDDDMVRAAAGGASVPAAFEPKKKKYAKEAWPGKKPTTSYL